MLDYNTQVFVFDFDGVICDSTNECLVSSWNTWQRWSGLNDFRADLCKFSKEDRESFFALRPRVRGAGEYFVLESMRAKGIKINNQQQYDAAVKKNSGKIQQFKALFYKERARLKVFDFNGWLNLHSVYPNVCQFLRDLNKSERLYIATLKDGKSVSTILNQHGIHIKHDRLFDESMIKTKLDALEKIRLREGVRPEKITFFDDNILHLKEPKRHGYNTYLAAWSNIPEEWISVAETSNIEIIYAFCSFAQSLNRNITETH